MGGGSRRCAVTRAPPLTLGRGQPVINDGRDFQMDHVAVLAQVSRTQRLRLRFPTAARCRPRAPTGPVRCGRRHLLSCCRHCWWRQARAPPITSSPVRRTGRTVVCGRQAALWRVACPPVQRASCLLDRAPVPPPEAAGVSYPNVLVQLRHGRLVAVGCSVDLPQLGRQQFPLPARRNVQVAEPVAHGHPVARRGPPAAAGWLAPDGLEAQSSLLYRDRRVPRRARIGGRLGRLRTPLPPGWGQLHQRALFQRRCRRGSLRSRGPGPAARPPAPPAPSST